jgi:uridine phosphorylase
MADPTGPERTTEDLALLEFDGDEDGVFGNTATPALVDPPLAAVGSFFPEVVSSVAADGRHLAKLPSSELWEVDWDDHRLATFYPGIGAPLAVASLERAVAVGCRSFVFCGGAGAVIPQLALGHVVIPTHAVRDEGTSFHYVPAGREIAAVPTTVAVLDAVCSRHDAPHSVGKTWSTDGLFRETPARIARRRREGCLVVECEASALFAVGEFRGVDVGVLLYAADDVSTDKWDERGWKDARLVRQSLFDLAAEAALELAARRAG